MRRPLVAANWKMNGCQSMAQAYCRDLAKLVEEEFSEKEADVDIVICPPATLLSLVGDQLKNNNIDMGTQDIDNHDAGAFTGQISAAMAVDAGASHAIIGHSERRSYFGETDALVTEKITTALSHDLIPILCIGETQIEREQENTEQVVAMQLESVIDSCGIEAFNRIVIAYEPVWAIGTGLTATPSEAQQVHQFIRNKLQSRDSTIAAVCRILYGGSMKPENAGELIAQTDIDGGLIGGASLDPNHFFSICNTAASS